MPFPGCTTLIVPESPHLRSTHWSNLLPAVACKRSRERKQQIKTVPFMMAARRTLIVPLTIYTKAGRLKGTLREEAGHGEASWWRGWGVYVQCAAGVSVCHACWQLALLSNELVGQRWSPSGLQNPDLSTNTSSFSPFII